MAVAVGVGGPAHRRVLRRVREQPGELAVDRRLVGADEPERARRDPLRALGGVAHDEHGLAEAGGLLLDPAGVGEDEVRGRHEVVEVHDPHGLHDPQAVEAVELGVGGPSHQRVHVYGVDGLDVGVLRHHAADGAEHAVHGLAQVLAAVRRYEDEAGALSPPEDGVEDGARVSRAHRRPERVDARVARDPDAARRLALAEEVLPRRPRGGEPPMGDHVHRLAVELLRPGAVEVARPEARLHVAHRNLQVEAGERGGEGRGGVAVHEHGVRALGLEHRPEPQQHVARDVEERLPRPHDVQVVVRLHLEDREHLLEHLAVLPRDAHDCVELVRTGLELVHERTHLDRLRAGAEDEHYFFH